MSPIRTLPESGCSRPDDRLEQGGLADPVRADHADDPVARQRERQILDQHPAVEALVEVLHLDHHVAQPRARRDLDLLEVQLAVLLGFRGHLLVALQPGPALGLPGLGTRSHPGQLVHQPLAQLGVLAALYRYTLGLLLQVGGVVALVGVGPATVDLEDPLGDVVQEVPVVGDREDGARRSWPGAAPATARSPRPGGWSARRAATGRACSAAACTAPPGAAHHRTAG